MLKLICPQNCKRCFCEPICALGAIIAQAGGIYVETDKCIGCGACRRVCITFSLDKALKDKTEDWLKGVA